ncbi:MAG: nicotinate-nucleotide adenylyltransferase [bacterium]
MQKRKRTGILGGLFDPPHSGHLIIAQFVLEEFQLHNIIFVPAGNPPHKQKYSPYDIRYKMTELAIRNNPKFSISDIEKKISGKTYTVEVVKNLKHQIRSMIYLIIGCDQWEEIGTWKTPEELFKWCKVIVMPRPRHSIKKVGRFCKKILISHAPLIDISSSLIRKRVKHNCSIQYLVPNEVYKYIKRKRLY